MNHDYRTEETKQAAEKAEAMDQADYLRYKERLVNTAPVKLSSLELKDLRNILDMLILDKAKKEAV